MQAYSITFLLYPSRWRGTNVTSIHRVQSLWLHYGKCLFKLQDMLIRASGTQSVEGMENSQCHWLDFKVCITMGKHDIWGVLYYIWQCVLLHPSHRWRIVVMWMLMLISHDCFGGEPIKGTCSWLGMRGGVLSIISGLQVLLLVLPLVSSFNTCPILKVMRESKVDASFMHLHRER